MKKLLFIISFALFAFTASAQLQGRELLFYQNLGGATNIELDTVTNTATNFVTSQRSGGGATSTTIVVTITKISGTVAGTLTLYGCNTGCGKTTATTTWVRINQPDLQTAVPTITAADASALYSWTLSGSPTTYYRVSWTGSGTMAASFKANLMSH